MSPRRLYIDNAATSFPKPRCVIDAMVRYATELGVSPWLILPGLIVSGILRAQGNSVVRALCRIGLQKIVQRRRGKWIALRSARKS